MFISEPLLKLLVPREVYYSSTGPMDKNWSKNKWFFDRFQVLISKMLYYSRLERKYLFGKGACSPRALFGTANVAVHSRLELFSGNFRTPEIENHRVKPTKIFKNQRFSRIWGISNSSGTIFWTAFSLTWSVRPRSFRLGLSVFFQVTY